ncbi:MAG: hypothetical protein J5905_03025 [Prevotella sp.]|nr:hypothetical protein [Prevotella sp.]
MSQIRKIYYRLCAWFPYKRLRPSKEEIDVVIPVIAKDLEILPLCLEGVRRCVAHPIKNIYLVAPDEEKIRSFCDRNGLVFVDETSVLGIKPKDLNIMVDGRDRSGWLFQQLIKLSGKVGTCDRYLCIDSDHILVREHVFVTEEGKTVFYMSYEKNEPYYRNIHRLFPEIKMAGLSYVAHKMLFSKDVLRRLHEDLAERGGGGKTWIEVIRDNYDCNCFADFSEFELYGNYMTEERKVRRPWLQKLLRYKDLADYDTLYKRWNKRRMSLTFPAYRK